jgi:putative spermidine/putrescine transport system substrate-binding protein
MNRTDKGVTMKKIPILIVSLILLAGAATIAVANGTQETAAAGPLLTQAPASFDDLVTAAKKEGQLSIIATPRDWANYGEIIDTFAKKYGIKINELNPEGSSADEIEAVKANKANKGPQAPDVLDVGLKFGPQAKADGLLSPYKVRTWSTMPDGTKDPEGYWYGNYYGTMAFEVNLDVVKNPPLDWADLLQPQFKGQVALAGDPRSANQAIMSVLAAGLGNKGTLDSYGPALDFFAALNKAGNFVPLIATAGTVASGETPITMRWDYNALGNRDKTDGNPNIGVIIPASGQVAGMYAAAISAYAPHPNAARLWMEYIYSDEAQLMWLKGGAHPIRYADLAARNAIPADIAARLPAASAYSKVVFPSLAQQTAVAQYITDNWDTVVGVTVKK